MRRKPVVYFVQRDDGRIKVGYTKFLSTRLKKLSGSHGDLKVLRVIDGGSIELEKHIHKQLEPHNDFGEWFRECDEVLAAVQANYDEVIQAADKTASEEWAAGEARLRDEAQQAVQKMVNMRVAAQSCTKEKAFELLSRDYGIALWTLRNLYIARVSTVTAYTLEVVRAARHAELKRMRTHLNDEFSLRAHGG